MFTVAIIGSGFVAKQHAQAYLANPHARLAAIVNPDPELARELVEETGCAWHPSLEDALKSGPIDVCDVCVPTWLHEEYVVKAAKAGCHVLCEKPVTFTVSSLDRMLSACRENNVRFMVAQVARWWPEFLVIRNYLEQGRLGKIHMIYEKRLCTLPEWTAWHRDPKKSGGGLYDLNIHDVDFLVSVYGRPSRVYAVGWKTEAGCWMHVATSIAWPGGVTAVVDTCLEMSGPWPFSIEFRASGDNGTLHYALEAGVNIADGVPVSSFRWYASGAKAPEDLKAEQTNMFAAEISEFLAAIREGRPAAVTPEQSRLVLEVIEATHKSLEEGVPVAL